MWRDQSQWQSQDTRGRSEAWEINTSALRAPASGAAGLNISSQSPGAKPPRGLLDISSAHQDNLPKSKRDLVAKMKVLKTELSSLQPASGHCRLEVTRGEVFEDSYRQVVKMRPKDMRKRLMVKFQGEEGLDYGGVAREWLYLLSHEMLNPYYGLFQYSREDIYTLQVHTNTAFHPHTCTISSISRSMQTPASILITCHISTLSGESWASRSSMVTTLTAASPCRFTR